MVESETVMLIFQSMNSAVPYNFSVRRASLFQPNWVRFSFTEMKKTGLNFTVGKQEVLKIYFDKDRNIPHKT